MRKKLVFGSVLVFTLLLLTPSISAIQHNTIEGADTFENIDKIELNILDNDTKYLNLNYLINLMIKSRIVRALLLFMVSAYIDNFTHSLVVTHPIIYFRSLWLEFTCMHLIDFFQYISDKYGWNWEIEYY
jgi:hypothetical protein